MTFANNLVIKSLMFAVLAGAFLPHAEAQAPTKKPPKLKVHNQEYLFWNGNKERPMEMPGVTFPGKPAEYLNGFYNEKTGARAARFKVPESGEAVLAYYSAAMNSGGWTCSKPTPQNPNSVTAHNSTMRATVSISTHATPGRPGCEVYFVYGSK